MSAARPPESLTLAGDALTVQWPGETLTVAAATLRRGCRCAPCESARRRGEAAAPGDTPALVGASPVGHYAVQLHFSDGHERGIYPWAYLRELALGR